ncbi:hypothetical protein [Streptosporangium sp. NPDC000396]
MPVTTHIGVERWIESVARGVLALAHLAVAVALIPVFVRTSPRRE